jgi:hypothetical protein
MDKQFKFTDARIRALPASPGSASSTDLEVSDTEITGLKCLSGETGRKRFLLRYIIDGRKRSIGLGRFPEVDVATARSVAQRFRRMLAEEQDPKHEQLAASQRPTVSAFCWDTFLSLQKEAQEVVEPGCAMFSGSCRAILGASRL